MPGGDGQPFGVTILEVPGSAKKLDTWKYLGKTIIFICLYKNYKHVERPGNTFRHLFGVHYSDGLKLGLLQCTEVLKSELSRNAQSKKCPVHFSGCGSQEMNIHEHPSYLGVFICPRISTLPERYGMEERSQGDTPCCNPRLKWCLGNLQKERSCCL